MHISFLLSLVRPLCGMNKQFKSHKILKRAFLFIIPLQTLLYTTIQMVLKQSALGAVLLLAMVALTTAGDPAQSECGIAFRGKCTCGMAEYDRHQRYVVNCTNAGFSSTNVLESMPSEVEVVIFTGNLLQTLPWNIFGTINEYPLLRIIDMRNNHIGEIRGKTYHHVQQVERLILDHNNISISPTGDELNHLHPRIFSNFINLRALHLTDAFADFTSPDLSKNLHAIFINSNLTKLNILHLEQNEIVRFKDRNVFCDLPQLMDLHLGDNNLNEINFNITCLRHLRFLDLERNRFETVNQRDMDTLTKLSNLPGRGELIVDFSRNPFQCDCSIFDFVNWLRTTNVTVRNRNGLMCSRTDEYTEPVLQLAFRKCLVRSLEHTTTTGHQVTLIFLLVALLFVMVGLIGALIYVSKDRIKYFVSPVVSSRKVQYTTIRDDEIAQEVHL